MPRERLAPPVSSRQARLYLASRDGEAKLLEELLGAPPRYEVTIDDVQYVIPEGIDPYWQLFRTAMGYELLPAEEQPQPVLGRVYGHPPERPQDCLDAGVDIPISKTPRWRMPERPTWPAPSGPSLSDPPPKALVSWRALGDLRRAARFAVQQPLAFLSPRPSVELGELHEHLVGIGAQVDELIRRLHALRTRKPAKKPARKPPPDAERLGRALERLDRLARKFSADLRDYYEQMAAELEATRQALEDLLLTGASIEPKSRSPRGAPPGSPLVFVHLAHCILRAPHGFYAEDGERIPFHWGIEVPNAELLAMVDALDSPRVGPHDFIRNRRPAVKYWRSALGQYQRELKGEPPAPPSRGVLEPAAAFRRGSGARAKRSAGRETRT